MYFFVLLSNQDVSFSVKKEEIKVLYIIDVWFFYIQIAYLNLQALYML